MKITILYGSTTGTTEAIAGILERALSGHEVTVMNVTDVKDAVLKASDYILLGSSTWGYGELQDDFADYIDTMTEEVFKEKSVGVFGAGDEAGFTDVFCEAVKIITNKLEYLGANVVIEGLKIDGDANDHVEEIEAFAAKVN